MTDPQTPANDDTTAKRGSMETSYNAARASARKAIVATLDSARDGAARAARRTAEAVEGNPLAVLAGGIAVGVLAGALLPKTERESALLGPVGKRLTEGATTAAKAARDAGVAELASAGISRDALREQAEKIVGKVMSAVQDAGDAAARAAKTAKPAA